MTSSPPRTLPGPGPSSSTASPLPASSSNPPAADLDIPTPTSIEVLIRVRPLLTHESDASTRAASSIISTLEDNQTVAINHPAKQLQCKYDYSFPPSCAQSDIYSRVSQCATALANGFNATIFAYGQTGSGKTHTMFGPDGYDVRRTSYGGPNHAVLNESAGVIPRSIVQIFKELNRKDLGIVSTTVYVSFVQVYNEQLYDMLRDPRRSSSLEIHEEPGVGIYVSGLSEYAVRNAGDCLALVKLGEENRAIRETHMNTASSRSHSLFQIVVEQTRIEDGAEGERVLKSKFNLVDLAGSEKWDTKKDRKFETEQIEELTNINLSLYTLGRCIAALSKNGKALEKDPDAILGHVPYRESKLTRLLQDSLGGNSKTVLIATLSPASDCLDETISTLRFADRAHSVMTFVKLNEKRPVDHALVQRLQSEVARLRALLKDGGQVAEATVTGIVSTPINDSGPALQAALEKIIALQTENNKLRKRLGMPELPVGNSLPGTAVSPRLSTPQRHAPGKFAIVGGGNSSAAEALRNLGTMHSPQSSEETKGQLIEMRTSHERVTAIMTDLERVTSRFFTFDIEEEELKDSVLKLMRLFKKEKKSYSEMFQRIDGATAGGGSGSKNKRSKKSNKLATTAPSFESPAAANMSGPPSTFKKDNTSPFGSSSPSRTVGGGTEEAATIDSFTSGGLTVASSVGVAYRIRERGAADKMKAAPSTLSPQRSAHKAMARTGGASVDGGSGWIQTEEDEEAKLRKELKAAKARMKKQTEMQEWLEKKEEKALKQMEEEEEARKQYQKEQKEKDKQFRNRAKKQKRKLEKYYQKLRQEMGALGVEQGEAAILENGMLEGDKSLDESHDQGYGSSSFNDGFDDGAGF
ncbi:hypothetical protein TrST_g3436 [Triparma strigata]|uniref:Kinesin-like protein n=1 Tax=Triparma strigata TaxID=1606541 RepID=A0A9W7A6P5_9STRA|nr:hypothetical protein TrST_g3436 [Triparma strigata]